jgi:predicted DNA-binding transcriptional regulator AlpA
VGLSHSLIATSGLCGYCHKETRFLPMQFALALTGRCRSTIYNWMVRGWVHWLELPNGRRVICEESLRPRHADPKRVVSDCENNIAKLSTSVQ